MDISVTMRERGLDINPPTARVRVGETINWICSSDLGVLSWTVYFSAGSPLAWSRAQGTAAHGHLAAGVAQTAGDWKYGVRVQHPVSDMVLADDDPFLIITP